MRCGPFLAVGIASLLAAGGSTDSLLHVRVDDAIARPGTTYRGRAVLVTDRLRLQLAGGDQRAGLVVRVRGDGGGLDGTSPAYGDWTFVDRGVVTEPAAVTVLDAGPEWVAARWSFADHRTGPAGQRRPRYAYPFTKTVWARRGENGVFVLVEPERALPPDRAYAQGVSEHEIGFGGLFGPALVTAGRTALRTERLTATRVIDPSPRNVARLERDGDPLTRVLVPLPSGEMIVPRFSAQAFGGVFIHHRRPGPYGAYLYMAPREAAMSTEQVVAHAWATAPFDPGRLRIGR